MATNVFERYCNPISGETFQCLSLRPEAYVMQWTLEPKGYVPFEHVHYHQEELFEVRKGALQVVINGVCHIAGPGERISVPVGARHIASNNGDEVMEAVVSYVPALDQETFFKCFIGLSLDGYLDYRGGVNIPMMGYCLRKMKCRAMARPTNIPAPAFHTALRVFYFAGLICGWRQLYERYTQ